MLSLLSTLGGLLISGLPKMLEYFQNKADQKHELALAELQKERELALAAQGFIAQQRVEEIRSEQVAMETDATADTTEGTVLQATEHREDQLIMVGGVEVVRVRALTELGSQQVRAELQLLASLERALDDSRSASRVKDEFLAMLGHELRNPLSPIVASLDLMLTLVSAGYALALVGASQVAACRTADVTSRPLAGLSPRLNTYLLRPDKAASEPLARFIGRAVAAPSSPRS